LAGFNRDFRFTGQKHIVRLSKTSAAQIQTLKTQKLKEKYLLKKQTNPDIKAQALAIFCR